MAGDEGVALVPWSSLGGGFFKTEDQLKSGEGRNRMHEAPPYAQEVVQARQALDKATKKHKNLVTSVVS